jgi:enoyl-CoA hydratase
MTSDFEFLEWSPSFEELSAGLNAAVNGRWQVADADGGEGVLALTDKASLWQQRRGLARGFWSDGPDVSEAPAERRNGEGAP